MVRTAMVLGSGAVVGPGVGEWKSADFDSRVPAARLWPFKRFSLRSEQKREAARAAFKFDSSMALLQHAKARTVLTG